MTEPTLEQIELVPQSGTVNTRTLLSPSLVEAVQEKKDNWPDSHKLLSPSELNQIQADVLSHMESLGHEYHNGLHVGGVTGVARQLSVAARLSPVESQLLELAAILHDYGHAGNTYRQLVLSASSNHLSNEEFAALKADEMVGSRVSVEQRITLQGLILATSFGQNNLERIPESIRSDAYRPYRPESKLEKLLAFADIAGGLSNFTAFDLENAALILEGGINSVPETFDSYLIGRIGFLSYLQSKFDDVKNLLEVDVTERYQSQIDNYKQVIRDYLSGSDGKEQTQMFRAFHEIRK